MDEASPTAAEPRLDMYDPTNGYRPLEEGPSSYSKDFLAEFRAGSDPNDPGSIPKPKSMPWLELLLLDD